VSFPLLPANAGAVRDALLRDTLRTNNDFQQRLNSAILPAEQFGITTDSTRLTIIEESTAAERIILDERLEDIVQRIIDLEMCTEFSPPTPDPSSPVSSSESSDSSSLGVSFPRQLQSRLAGRLAHFSHPTRVSSALYRSEYDLPSRDTLYFP
jgi:hypothetical protein